MDYLCVEKNGRSGRVVREGEGERVPGSDTISLCDGAAPANQGRINQSGLEDRGKVAGVLVPWISG